MSILDDLKQENYRIGSLQAMPYDRNNPIFGENYLVDLYYGLAAGRRTQFRRENLRMLFCGMNDLSLPAIVSYLASQKLVILGKWEGETLRTGGVCWANAVVGSKEKAAFGAYGFLRWIWGTEDQDWLGWLGLAYLMGETGGGLVQLHTQRYESNHLSAKFLTKFGFRDLAVIPKLIIRGEILENGVISTISRDDLENNLSQMIVAATLD